LPPFELPLIADTLTAYNFELSHDWVLSVGFPPHSA
jgi:hypothetical protein